MKKTLAFNYRGAILTGLFLCFSSVGCQKENATLNSVPRSSEPLGVKADKESFVVATDWCRLQTRIMLERNSAFNG